MIECPVCFNELTTKNNLNWLECPHSVCVNCFINSAVVYEFENQSMKIECPVCRTDINKITEGAELITVDMWTKLFRTVRRKKCRVCGEKNSPTPVVKNIDNCTIHQEVCMDCGIKIECKPPGCFFLKCIVCEENNTTPNFIGCFMCGTCPGHIKENPQRTVDMQKKSHLKIIGMCNKCYGMTPVCKKHWTLMITIPQCKCK